MSSLSKVANLSAVELLAVVRKVSRPSTKVVRRLTSKAVPLRTYRPTTVPLVLIGSSQSGVADVWITAGFTRDSR